MRTVEDNAMNSTGAQLWRSSYAHSPPSAFQAKEKLGHQRRRKMKQEFNVGGEKENVIVIEHMGRGNLTVWYRKLMF